MKSEIFEENKNTVGGWLWSLLDQFGARAISLIVGIILARLLEPKEFGLFASVSIFITISQQLIDGGIDQRAIQKYKISDEEYNALFFLNLVISLFMACLLITCSGLIAAFFELPELRSLVVALGFWIVLSSAGRVQQTKLIRETRYRKIASINLIAAIFGALGGVSMALADYGIWSLVGQMMFTAVVRVLLLWIAVPWIPSGLPRKEIILDLYSFGLPILVCQTIRSASNQLINVLTAKFFTPTILGFYNRGGLIPRTFLLSIGNVFTKVNFTSLSKLQKNPKRLRVTYLSFFSVGFGFAFLALSSMSIFSKDIILLVLGDKWVEATWYFQMACLLSISHVIFQLNVDLLKALGQTGIFFKGNMVCAVVQIIFILCGLNWGVEGMVIGDLLARIFAAFLLIKLVERKSEISALEQFREIFKIALWNGPLALVLLLIQSNCENLGSRIILGLLVCSGMGWFWWQKEHERLKIILNPSKENI